MGANDSSSFIASWPQGGAYRRELFFPPNGIAGYGDVLREAKQRGATSVLVHPINAATTLIATQLCCNEAGLRFYARTDDGARLPPGLAALPEGDRPDVTLILEQDPEAVSSCLLELLDIGSGLVLAPKTSHHFSCRPLFLISIPKSGTHLLYGLAEAFGYHRGIVCPDAPAPQTWYCVECSNSHTVARDFFVDTVRRREFGNRHHPFMRSPAVFIYRNPMDIVVSEASYYHRPGRAAFSEYFAAMDLPQRLLKLIGDDWLLGDIRSRIGGFAPWLELPNVIPVSFEELVGNNGGGSDTLQADTIWSLQLKLQVPGIPENYGQMVFNRNSATFNEGQIGGSSNHMNAPALRRFFALPQDFMEVFGYASSPKNFFGKLRHALLARLTPRALVRTIARIPHRIMEFRSRPLRCADNTFADTPITVEYNYLDLYNITRYRGKYVAVPHGLLPIDLDAFIEAPPPSVYIRNHLDRVKRLIDERYKNLTTSQSQ
jgi:hypothetical protein